MLIAFTDCTVVTGAMLRDLQLKNAQFVSDSTLVVDVDPDTFAELTARGVTFIREATSDEVQTWVGLNASAFYRFAERMEQRAREAGGTAEASSHQHLDLLQRHMVKVELAGLKLQ